MTIRFTITYIAVLCIPMSQGFSGSRNPIWVPDSSPQKLFDPMCHLEKQSNAQNAASQSTNLTHTTDPQDTYASLHQSRPTWASEPFCLPLSKSGVQYPPYCVWTSRDFNYGKGISIVATQEAANSLASSKWFLNAHLRAHHSSMESVSPPGYVLKPLAGRGLGLIANGTYKRGDLIMSEVPLLLSSLSLEKSNLTEKEQARLYRAAASRSRLPIDSVQQVMGLHGHPDPKSVHDRFKANAFNVFDFAGLFPHIARMNHDCRPNAAFYFDKHTFTQRIHAVRSIVPGDEITISYLSHYLPSRERHRRIHDHWGFKCSCNLCSTSMGQLDASDVRLRHIRELEVQIHQTLSLSTKTENDVGGHAIPLAEELLSLYREERLDNVLARAYDTVVAAYARNGYTKKAKEYAREGIEAARLWPGPGSIESVKMLKILEG